MIGEGDGWTTASTEAIPPFLDYVRDPTPGFVLAYSRLASRLPPAVPFSQDVMRIGREADNGLSIPEAAVSRYHGRVERRSDGDWIVDDGSTNGVLVNGVRVQSHRLVDHDVVRIGDTVFRYAARAIHGYLAYRIDGSIVPDTRRVVHGLTDCPLVGGYQMDQLLERLEKVARNELSIVVTGESGTGKELLARTVHIASGRRGPFQAINCGALPANLIESALFGHRKGAFTGATADKIGLVMAADKGTLLLDEVGDMPLDAQVKLLRVLQERVVLPIGATTPQPVDVRVVCATHRDLEALVQEGRFRGDLYARLRDFTVRMPPLRERIEDIYRLTRHFLARAGRPDARLSLAYMVGLTHYRWPYNVRELESAVKLSVALSEPHEELNVPHLPDPVRRALEGHGAPPPEPAAAPSPPSMDSSPSGSRSTAPSEAELRALLARHRGNIAAVGREVGKERMQVHRWLKRYGIDVTPYRQ